MGNVIGVRSMTSDGNDAVVGRAGMTRNGSTNVIRAIWTKCVDYRIEKHILDCATKRKQKTLF